MITIYNPDGSVFGKAYKREESQKIKRKRNYAVKKEKLKLNPKPKPKPEPVVFHGKSVVEFK